MVLDDMSISPKDFFAGLKRGRNKDVIILKENHFSRDSIDVINHEHVKGDGENTTYQCFMVLPLFIEV
jgi:hypothetical protein